MGNRDLTDLEKERYIIELKSEDSFKYYGGNDENRISKVCFAVAKRLTLNELVDVMTNTEIPIDKIIKENTKCSYVDVNIVVKEVI